MHVASPAQLLFAGTCFLPFYVAAARPSAEYFALHSRRLLACDDNKWTENGCTQPEVCLNGNCRPPCDDVPAKNKDTEDGCPRLKKCYNDKCIPNDQCTVYPSSSSGCYSNAYCSNGNCQNYASPPSSSPSSSGLPVGAIVGIAVGGVALILLAFVAYWRIRKYRMSNAKTNDAELPELDSLAADAEVVPSKKAGKIFSLLSHSKGAAAPAF
jgi:hypothetical protein